MEHGRGIKLSLGLASSVVKLATQPHVIIVLVLETKHFVLGNLIHPCVIFPWIFNFAEFYLLSSFYFAENKERFGCSPSGVSLLWCTLQLKINHARIRNNPSNAAAHWPPATTSCFSLAATSALLVLIGWWLCRLGI